MEREDLAVPAADAVMRREVARMEDAIPPFGVVALQRQVVVAEKAVGHHQVVRLVALGSHLRLHAHRDGGMNRESSGKEQPARRQTSRRGQRGRHAGERERGERRPAERA